jgi:hypothetical protein
MLKRFSPHWGVFAALAALSLLVVGAGAAGRAAPHALGTAAGISGPSPTFHNTDLGRLQPRARYTSADYQTGGVGLRNQRRGVITINGVTAAPIASFVYWAVIFPGAAPASYTATLTRLWPLGSGATTTLFGALQGTDDSPCWGGGAIGVYRAGVSSPSVVPGNGVYMMELDSSAPSGGQDPWVSSPLPMAEGASLVVIYPGTGTTMLYDAGLSGNSFFASTGLTYGLATISYPGTHAHWDEIGADGQKGFSRTATADVADETTTINGTTFAGPGSLAIDSDWNGNDSTPLPSLWDTRGHNISSAVTAGSTTVNVVTGLSASGGPDCLTSVANVLHFG